MITGSTTFAELVLLLDRKGLGLRQLRAVGDRFEVVLRDKKRKYAIGVQATTIHEAINDAIRTWEEGQ